MAIKHLTYLSLSTEQRATAAGVARGRIKTMMSNPWLTPTQAEQLRKELEHVGRWEKGTLPVAKEKGV